MRAENGNLRAGAGGGSGGDEDTAAGAHVFGERMFQKRRQRIEIGENDEGVIGRLTVRGLVDDDRFQDKGRLRSRRERGADIERRTVVAVVMDQQGFLRIGTLDGKAAQVVGREAVRVVDLDFAAAEAVGHFERGEVDGGPSVGGDSHGLGGGGLAVHHQRDGALRCGRAVAGNHGLYVNRLGVLAPDLSGGIHRFHRPVGLGLRDYGMRHQGDVGGQRHVLEAGGQVAALHVAEHMKLDGSMDRFGHGANGARQLAEVTVAIAGLNGLHRGAQRRLVLNGLGHEPQLRPKRRHLGARGALSGKHAHGRGFGGGQPGIGNAGSGPHAEGVVQHQQHQPVAGKGGRVAVDEGIGEGQNQQQQHQQTQ